MVDTSRKVCSYVFLLKQICTQKHDLGIISTPSPAAITGKIWSFHHEFNLYNKNNNKR
jgi:hypothetical protein